MEGMHNLLVVGSSPTSPTMKMCNCGNVIPNSLLIDGIIKRIKNRSKCLDCSPYMNKILTAIRFADNAHNGQLRKNKTAYIHHPLSVAMTVALLPDSTEDMVVAAVLHDTVEDCDVTENDIQDLFGMNVAKLVMELTDVYTKSSYKHLNRNKRRSLELKRLRSISVESKIIKLADRLHNLESRGMTAEHLKKNYLPESIQLIDAIGDACPALATKCRKLVEEVKLSLK